MKRYTLIIYLIMVSCNIYSQQEVEVIFDFSPMDYVYDFIKLEKGGFLMLAAKQNGLSIDQLYVKLDENGDTVSIFQTYDQSAIEIIDIDSFYYEVGYGAAMTGGTLLKRDSLFNHGIGREFGSVGSRTSHAHCIKKTKDNNLILIVDYYDVHSGGGYSTLSILDKTNLEDIWSLGEIGIYSYVELNDSSIISCGLSRSKTDYITKIFRHDNKGHAIYSTPLPGISMSPQIETLVFEKSAFLAYRANVNNTVNNYLTLSKVDVENGTVLWSKSYFKNLNAKLISSCNGYGNNMIILGTCLNDNKEIPYIFTFNTRGDSLSTLFIDKFDSLIPKKVIASDDYCYLVGTIIDNTNQRDIYFLKTLLDTTNISMVDSVGEIQEYFTVFPNPMNNVFWLKTNYVTSQKLKLVATSINGSQSHRIELISDYPYHQINTSKWHSGVYILALYEDQTLKQTKKIIVLK